MPAPVAAVAVSWLYTLWFAISATVLFMFVIRAHLDAGIGVVGFIVEPPEAPAAIRPAWLTFTTVTPSVPRYFREVHSWSSGAPKSLMPLAEAYALWRDPRISEITFEPRDGRPASFIGGSAQPNVTEDPTSATGTAGATGGAGVGQGPGGPGGKPDDGRPPGRPFNDSDPHGGHFGRTFNSSGRFDGTFYRHADPPGISWSAWLMLRLLYAGSSVATAYFISHVMGALVQCILFYISFAMLCYQIWTILWLGLELTYEKQWNEALTTHKYRDFIQRRKMKFDGLQEVTLIMWLMGLQLCAGYGWCIWSLLAIVGRGAAALAEQSRARSRGVDVDCDEALPQNPRTQATVTAIFKEFAEKIGRQPTRMSEAERAVAASQGAFFADMALHPSTKKIKLPNGEVYGILNATYGVLQTSLQLALLVSDAMEVSEKRADAIRVRLLQANHFSSESVPLTVTQLGALNIGGAPDASLWQPSPRNSPPSIKQAALAVFPSAPEVLADQYDEAEKTMQPDAMQMMRLFSQMQERMEKMERLTVATMAATSGAPTGTEIVEKQEERDVQSLALALKRQQERSAELSQQLAAVLAQRQPSPSGLNYATPQRGLSPPRASNSKMPVPKPSGKAAAAASGAAGMSGAPAGSVVRAPMPGIALKGEHGTTSFSVGRRAMQAPDDTCAFVVAAIGLHAMAKDAQSRTRPGEVLTNFASEIFVAQQGTDSVIAMVDAKDRVGKASDAYRVMCRLLCGQTLGGEPLKNFYAISDDEQMIESCKGARKIAALCWRGDKKHWTIATADGTRFRCAEGNELVDAKDLPGTVFWLFRRSKALFRNGTATKSCGCGKRHKLSGEGKKCTACNKSFYGLCGATPTIFDMKKPDETDADFYQASETAPFCCMACAAKRSAEAWEAEANTTLAEAARVARERRHKQEAEASVPAAPGSAKKYDNELQLGAGGVAYDVPTPGNVVQHAPHDDPRYATGVDPTGRFAPPPSAVALTGGWMLMVVLISDIANSPANAMAVNAKAKTTRTFHLSDLKGFQAFVQKFPEVHHCPLAQAAVCYLQHTSVTARRQWKPQTFFRRMLNMVGALGSMPIYSDCPYPIRLSQDPVWSETLDRAKYMAMECAPTGQSATVALDILVALNKEPLSTVRIAILLMWHTAARVGDVLKMRKRAIKLEGDSLSITIEEGKGVKLRNSKYTAHTKITGHWRSELVRHLATLKPDDLVVPPTAQCRLTARASAVNRALQRANPLFTTRSVRRGSLQAMAKGVNTQNPTPMETLQRIAGHKSRYTTERYLDMGMEDGEARKMGMSAADNLLLEGMEQAAGLGLDDADEVSALEAPRH